jgi:hypothetical protein
MQSLPYADQAWITNQDIALKNGSFFGEKVLCNRYRIFSCSLNNL